jgi:hypothetical protein
MYPRQTSRLKYKRTCYACITILKNRAYEQAYENNKNKKFKCSCCGVYKIAHEGFHRNQNYPTAFVTRCKICETNRRQKSSASSSSSSSRNSMEQITDSLRELEIKVANLEMHART